MSGDAFPIFRRGELREEILTYFRNGLRDMVNPDTGAGFTEDEIALATSELSDFFAEADALDIVLLAKQSRGVWLFDQMWADRASGEMLKRHGDMWEEGPLPASGGSGTATGPCVAGSMFVGSTTIPDDAADYAVDSGGRRYQVLFSLTAAGTTCTLTFKAIDTGRQTNLEPGSVLRMERGPVGADKFEVDARFTGGVPAETAASFAKRIVARQNKRQGAGNRAMVRGLARKVDASIADAFVYSCAYHAGSMHVALLAKRDQGVGPLATIPSAGAVAIVSAALTPPGTRELPGQPFSITTAVRSSPLNVGLRIDLGSGWQDLTPFPTSVITQPSVASVTSQTLFRITVDATVPRPTALAPSLMIWDVNMSRWEKLKVASVTYVSATSYDVELVTAPSHTIAVGDFISPYTKRHLEIARAVELYFDSLGPGELVSDERLSRAYRYPQHSVAWPSYFASSEAARWLKEALGPALGARGVASVGGTPLSTSVPFDPQAGPFKLTLSKLGIYPPV